MIDSLLYINYFKYFFEIFYFIYNYFIIYNFFLKKAHKLNKITIIYIYKSNDELESFLINLLLGLLLTKFVSEFNNKLALEL